VYDLARSAWLERLATLKLNSDRGLADDGVRLLANSPHLAQLTCLDLSDNWIRNAGAAVLAASPYLERLAALRLNRNPIGRDGKRPLQARFGPRVWF
jgi:Ran GTPase-activating protein (RanGAP) involved in mRNA processing and transport